MISIEIQKLMIEKGLKKKELAEMCGWTPANFGMKLKRNSWTEDELLIVAKALDVTLEIRFVPSTQQAH